MVKWRRLVSAELGLRVEGASKRLCLLKQLLDSRTLLNMSQELSFRSRKFFVVVDNVDDLTSTEEEMGHVLHSRVVRRPLAADKLAALAPQSVVDMLVQ